MAISKQQPERPALIQVVDAVNALDGILNTFMNRFRLGLTGSITVEMSDSVSDTLSFNTPFDESAEVAVFLVCVDGSEILTDLSCKLISATYSGFSYAVLNNSQADVSIKVGFLAVRMN